MAMDSLSFLCYKVSIHKFAVIATQSLKKQLIFGHTPSPQRVRPLRYWSLVTSLWHCHLSLGVFACSPMPGIDDIGSSHEVVEVVINVGPETTQGYMPTRRTSPSLRMFPMSKKTVPKRQSINEKWSRYISRIIPQTILAQSYLIVIYSNGKFRAVGTDLIQEWFPDKAYNIGQRSSIISTYDQR